MINVVINAPKGKLELEYPNSNIFQVLYNLGPNIKRNKIDVVDITIKVQSPKVEMD